MKVSSHLLISTLLLTLFVLIFAAPPVSAQEATGEPTSKSLLDLYQQGGMFMHLLAICSIGTVAVAVYCFLLIDKKKICPDHLVESLTQYMRQQDAGNAYELCRSNPNVLSTTLSSALLKVNFERDLANKVSMEQAAAETIGIEETKIMVWVNYLNVFATIAPMIGLLGTVTGMINSFDQLAAGRSEPQDLAGGIGEAMLTTAGGLIVGIPAMFFYFFFRNRLMTLMGDVQKSVTFLIDVLSGELKLAEAVAPTIDPAHENAETSA